MARVFVGLHTRTMALWLGGIYTFVVLLGNPAQVAQARLRAESLWPRLLRFEALCRAALVPREVLDFEAHFLWVSNPLYREMLALLAHGHVRIACDLAWRIFAGIYQEKGGQAKATKTAISIQIRIHSKCHLYSVQKPWLDSFAVLVGEVLQTRISQLCR